MYPNESSTQMVHCGRRAMLSRELRGVPSDGGGTWLDGRGEGRVFREATHPVRPEIPRVRRRVGEVDHDGREDHQGE